MGLLLITCRSATKLKQPFKSEFLFCRPPKGYSEDDFHHIIRFCDWFHHPCNWNTSIKVIIFIRAEFSVNLQIAFIVVLCSWLFCGRKQLQWLFMKTSESSNAQCDKLQKKMDNQINPSRSLLQLDAN